MIDDETLGEAVRKVRLAILESTRKLYSSRERAVRDILDKLQLRIKKLPEGHVVEFNEDA